MISRLFFCLMAAVLISACSTTHPVKYATITTTQNNETFSPLIALSSNTVSSQPVEQCEMFLSSMAMAEQKIGAVRPYAL